MIKYKKAKKEDQRENERITGNWKKSERKKTRKEKGKEKRKMLEEKTRERATVNASSFIPVSTKIDSRYCSASVLRHFSLSLHNKQTKNSQKK